MIALVVTFAAVVAAKSSSDSEKVALEGAEVGKWTMDYEAARQLAEEKDLPMLLNFTGSDWCGWCQLMDEKVFAEEEWKKYASEHAVLVTLDFPKDEGIVPEKYVARNQKLREKFGVGGYPTYVILDSDGETKLGQLGASRDAEPASFINDFKRVVQLSEGSIADYVEKNPGKAEDFKKAVAEYREATNELEDWIKTRPERNDENVKKFETFRERISAAESKLGEFLQ